MPNTTRLTAGTHRKLNPCYEWPPAFGTLRRHSVSVKSNKSEVVESRHIDEIPTNIMDKQDEVSLGKVSLSQKDKLSPRLEPKDVGNDLPETSSVLFMKSSISKAESVLLRRKRHAVEVEKIRQAIEMKKLENQLKISELENEVRETEITELQEYRSKSSMQNIKGIPDDEKHSLENTRKWINNSPSPTKLEIQPEEGKEKTSEIKLLCNTISEAIKSVANASQQNRFTARQVIDKDFSVFDGTSEEWPTFISQFMRISKLCEYSSEEMMIKLQKCLRGEAKLAVSGMMTSPDNIDLVLRTLEMRFGRPDQIIEGLIMKVRNLPPIKENNMDTLIYLSNHVCCLVATIKSLDHFEHLQNPQVLRELLQKLPDSLKLQWGEEIMRKKGTTNLDDFSIWINEKATAACFVSSSKGSKVEMKPKQFQFSSKRQETTLISTDVKNYDEKCGYCNVKGHKIQQCSKMTSDDVDTRWAVITKQKLCFSCLRHNHQTMKCRTRRQCNINGCKRSHHRLLHKDTQRPVENTDNHSTQSECRSNENVLAVGHGKGNVLLRMVKVKLYGNNTILETVALCDEASSVTLVDKSIANKLGLDGTPQPLCIQWTNNLASRHDDSSCVNLEISGVFDGAKIFGMKNVRTVQNLALPVQEIRESDWERYSYLSGIPFHEIRERPMILLGQDNVRLTVARKVIQSTENLPIATKTNLGWILHGGNCIRQERQVYSFHICSSEISDVSLHEMVKQSFTADAFGVVPMKTNVNKAERRAVEIMENTVRRVGERFEIGLLWKEDNIHLPESKSIAIQRLKCVEKQMRKDKDFGNRYSEKIASYVKKGYARKLTPAESNEEGPRCWYLPHFGVINPNKPGKLRLVFDAASKSKGTSLNDNLLSGPDLLQSLVEVLVKFRQRKIGFCSDVKEMFHQVMIKQEDRSSQRFLWRDGDMNRQWDVYEMQVMTFGATCSPTCAQFVKNMNAKESSNQKNIVEAITRKHYVDDYLDSTDSVDEALKTISEVSRIQKLGGFELANWICNSEEVMEKLSSDDSVFKNFCVDSNSTMQRVLGLSWDSKLDIFCFKITKFDEEFEDSRPTKRQILKTVMSIFDPLGFIVNFTIKGRILIQDIWRSGIGWDDSIDEDLYHTWKLWQSDLRQIENISIPRCYSLKIPQANRTELHVFCDASKKAYAVASYLRVLSEDGIDVTLVMARARVAPTKPISIPRLELQAAVMGSRLSKTIRDTLEIKIDEVFLWSDSTTVLFWIKGDGSKLGQFEGHRIGEIQELTNTDDWNWIPSKLNSADIATRTYTKDDGNVTTHARWFTGPDFLYESDKTLWPRKNSVFMEDPLPGEAEITAVTTEEQSYLPDINRFSKWSRLIRVTAWVLRFVDVLLDKLRKGNRVFLEQLEVSEIQKSEILWIKRCQQESFGEEIRCITKGRSVINKSRLKSLSPIIDERGLLLLSGRTNLAPEMSISANQPIILPTKHQFTQLLLQHYHEKFAHQGVEAVLNDVRQRFWIIDGRSALKSAFKRCQKCRISKAKPIIPKMGQLPVVRLTPNIRPFTYTGMDYFGPLLVSIGRRREKRWGVIFTCLTIRAVHLEVAHSLTTESAILAIRRMVARRGQPKEIHSDNGTNFRGAAEELKRALSEIDQARITDTFTQEGINWKFLTPASPHMGGAWERIVQSVKKAFYTILNGQVLKDELLQTILTECENVINTRPLTKVSTDPNDFESLTPNHFLLGSSNYTTDFGNKIDFRKEWAKSQRIIDCFWKRWTKEYLPSLTKRTKWNNDGKQLNINDMVIIVEENYPRRQWKLGRIEAVYPGPDGRVRVVSVRTTNGVFKRPVAKLCRIEMESG